ncbi:hypothetical protein CC1G_04386 [Coprinopsis cinerea okayama7|uniref:Uncharacterized protein n=1 Tax=Coprinopsis cinerea (strain Okayama-7 / 130 / ATCC MYA-4618 / FGSC 9003) TaxID=240176 RepID=A8N0G5_COPC7|nr:hypothetical protein CC1G_04386 [Coprinopsis cinerea okayama7\|eukprot:XP_001828415.1 hypothetical protein CC1G_04386 [Coprinopsis cinerea okayama7\
MPAPFRDTMTMETVQQQKQIYARQLAAYTRQQFHAVRKAANHDSENGDHRRDERSRRGDRSRGRSPLRNENETGQTTRGVIAKDYAVVHGDNHDRR